MTAGEPVTAGEALTQAARRPGRGGEPWHVTLARVLNRPLPQRILDAAAALPPPELDDREDAAEGAARLAVQRQFRADQWLRSLPAEYADATVDHLDARQNPRGAVAGWLAGSDRSLVLWSPVKGNGKSYAGYAVGSAAVAAGRWVIGWYVPNLAAALRPGSEPDPERQIEWAGRCDVLLLDDLGRERPTEWFGEQLGRILHERWTRRRRTVVTSNYTPAELAARYDWGVLERLTDAALVVEVTGGSRRQAPRQLRGA